MTERDISAISTWHSTEPPDPNADGHGVPYICTSCPWTGRGGVRAYAHQRITGHDVRGRHWPAMWGNAARPSEMLSPAERQARHLAEFGHMNQETR